MKYLMIALLFAAATAKATPYFRIMDPAHPHLSAGAFVDPIEPGNTSAGTSLALVTHSPADGCLLPTFVCENWSPLTVGFSANAGRALLGVGPSFNVAPVLKAGLLKVVDTITAEDKYLGLKSSLSSEPLSKSDLSTAIGPNLVFSPSERWKGRLSLFCGAAWRF